MKRYPLVLVAVLASLCVFCVMPRASWGQDTLDNAFKDVAAYKFGASRLSLTVVADAVRDSKANPEQRKALVEKLVGLLQGDSTLEGKDFACRQLSLVGGDESVPALAALIGPEATSNMARYALERIPGEAADKALIAALKKSEGTVLIGVINSLGVRKAQSAVKPLASFANGECTDSAKAACAALAKIGGKDAVKAIAKAKVAADCPAYAAWADAYLLAADKLVAEDKGDAIKVYDELLGADQPEPVRVAAFIGKAKAQGPDAVGMVVEGMSSDDVAIQRAASVFVRKLEANGATAAFAGLIGKLKPEGQVLLLSALSDRGDAAGLPAAVEAADSPDASVRTAAMAALGKLGNASVIPALLKVASTGEKEKQVERDAARLSLDTLRGADVDGAMAAALPAADDAQKVEIARTLAVRGAKTAVPALLVSAGAGADDVRKESFKALGELAGEADLPAMVDLLVKAQPEAVRKEAEKAVAVASKKVADDNKKTAAVLAALDATKDDQVVASLFNTLSLIGADSGLAPLRAAMKKSNDAQTDAAIRALASWPTASALDDVFAVVTNSKDDTHRVLSLRGLLRMLEMQQDRPAQESLTYLTGALKAAKDADEKKMVIGGLANVHDGAALKVVQPYLADEALKGEAAQAAQTIFKGMIKSSADINAKDTYRALDNDMESRWTTAAAMKGGEWYAMDLTGVYEISAITLDCSAVEADFPRGYQVFISKDANNMGAPVAEGKGEGKIVDIKIAPTAGQFIKIVQTGQDQHPWSINEIRFEFK